MIKYQSSLMQLTTSKDLIVGFDLLVNYNIRNYIAQNYSENIEIIVCDDE